MKIQSIISKNSKSKFRYVVIFSFLAVVGVLSVMFGNFLISNETTEESEASVIALQKKTILMSSGKNDYGAVPTNCQYSDSDENIYVGYCDNADKTAIESGMSFSAIDIPLGVTIAKASLVFTVDGPYSNPLDVEIIATNNFDKALEVVSVDQLSTQPIMATRVKWNITDSWTSKGTAIVDVTPLVQEIVKNSKWKANSNINFIFKTIGGEGHRRVFSFDREGVGSAPKLEIQYTRAGLNCGFCGMSCIFSY
jgi:hypothetical protein